MVVLGRAFLLGAVAFFFFVFETDFLLDFDLIDPLVTGFLDLAVAAFLLFVLETFFPKPVTCLKDYFVVFKG